MDRLDYMLSVDEILGRRDQAVERLANLDPSTDYATRRMAEKAIELSPFEIQFIGYPSQEEIDAAVQACQQRIEK